jgi:hypothetical protein
VKNSPASIHSSPKSHNLCDEVLGLGLPQVALDPCGGDGALRRSLMPFGVDVRLTDLYPEMHPAADGYVTSQPLDASEAEPLRYALELAGAGCTASITNTPHNTHEACAIVRNLIALVEEQHVDFVAALFRSIWGAEPGRLPYLNRPSFYGEILCCWRPRWIPGSEGSPMHAYAWYIWRKEPRDGPSLKVRVGRAETIAPCPNLRRKDRFRPKRIFPVGPTTKECAVTDRTLDKQTA